MEPGAAEFPAGDDPAGRAAKAALLHDLVRWREMLARSIARNNMALRSDGITMAVNRILFPLLLFRVAEDRNLVPEGTLAALCNGVTPQQFIRTVGPFADALYAGAPADPSFPGGDGTVPEVDDRIFQAVTGNLLSPERRYDFRRTGTEDVAEVLMQYLARKVRRSAAHMATVVDTHDTVISGGTTIPPQPVTRFLVLHAVASVQENRSPGDILPVRVFDPACGSGALLLFAYLELIRTSPVSCPPGEKRDLLMKSVYGLDINPHAVAATRLILLLGLFDVMHHGEVVEGFGSAALHHLGELQQTIRCGNALIGPEIIDDESWIFCPARDRHTLNPFSYRESFSEIVASGGFDLLVCNPPEGPLEQREWIQQYFQRRYVAYHPRADRSVYFFERALALAAPGGMVAMCMNGRWLRGTAGSPFRALLSTRRIEEIAELSAIPAGEPGAGLCLLYARASKPARQFTAISAGPAFVRDPGTESELRGFPVSQADLADRGWVLADTRIDAILEKTGRHSVPLEKYVMGQLHEGIRVPADDPFIISRGQAREWLRRDPRCRSLLRPVLAAADIARYRAGPAEKFLLVIPEGRMLSHKGKDRWSWLKRRHPQIARYLKANSEMLNAHAGPGGLCLDSDRDGFWLERRSRILFPARSSGPAFQFDSGRSVGDESLLAIPSAGRYLAGILNSRLLRFVLSRAAADKKDLVWDDLANLPVYMPDLDVPEDFARHERMERLVKRRIDLERYHLIASAGSEREAFEKKIRETEKQIDNLVYELYGLTEEEVFIVEGDTGR